MNPLYYIDFYKSGHVSQYPPDTQQVWSNWTARSSRQADQKEVVWFGLQYFMERILIEAWDDFFDSDWDIIESTYKEFMRVTLGVQEPRVDHIKALWQLNYLPLDIYALPEGTRVPLGVPMLVITNTLPEFYWLPNYMETILSNSLWKASTSATTALRFRNLFIKHAKAFGEKDLSFVDWQGHDFSYRGMSGTEDAILSGMGHLLSFNGTDTVPAIWAAHEYYDAPLSCGGSVPATEHSVMCAGTKEGEFETFKRLITETYPSDIVSIVSDTWDLWKVLTEYVPKLKPEILARDGKVVIRPDSGDPVKIMLGDDAAINSSPAWHGALDLLARAMETDGHGHINKAGLIYGDGISLERADKILAGCKPRGLSPFNVVFGIGSYCVAPETLILCDDLIWRRADSLSPGCGIVAFDEFPEFGTGIRRQAARRYKKAEIVANAPATKHCFTMTTDRGPSVTASHDHPWLVWDEHRSPVKLYGERGATMPKRHLLPRSAGLVWKTTSELHVGDKIAFLCKPWHTDESRNGGWLAGIVDGEGSLGRCTRKGVRVPSYKLNVTQNRGLVKARIEKEFEARDFSLYECARACPQLTLTGGWAEFLRFLGSIRPNRLLLKLPEIIAELPTLVRDRTYYLATVTGLADEGERTVSSITTTSGTFITNGYLSHNTYTYVTRDEYGFAMKATAVRRNGKILDIYKKPVTSDGFSKASLRGIPAIYKGRVGQGDETGKLYVEESLDPAVLDHCAFRKVFSDSSLLIQENFETIRKRVRED